MVGALIYYAVSPRKDGATRRMMGKRLMVVSNQWHGAARSASAQVLTNQSHPKDHARASTRKSTGLRRAGPMGRWRDIARSAEKSVRTPSQPAFRPSMGKVLPHAEPEAGALVPNTRLFRRPCDVPPAVTWAPPSAGAEKWEKWRKWLACQKYESDGPADCTVAFARRRRRRNDDDKDSISTFENQFSTIELLTIYRIEIQ